jgi:histidine ammonia-lyase
VSGFETAGYPPGSLRITCVLSLPRSIANNSLGAHQEYDEVQDAYVMVATPEVVAALAETFAKMPQLTSVK